MSGSLAGYYSPLHEALYFGSVGVAAVVVGLIVVAISPMIRRLMAGVR
jgi:POT family proton-dependent oligopeptide transporter